MKLTKCLIELFQSSILRESKHAQGLLVENAIKQAFGKKTVSKTQENLETVPMRLNKRQLENEDRDEISESEESSVSEGVVSDLEKDNNLKLVGPFKKMPKPIFNKIKKVNKGINNKKTKKK